MKAKNIRPKDEFLCTTGTTLWRGSNALSPSAVIMVLWLG